MKFEKATQFLTMLKKRLGDDLTYSFILDTNDEYYLIVSPHKSTTRKFESNKIQRCHITKNDYAKELFILVNEIAKIYENILIDKEPENVNE